MIVRFVSEVPENIESIVRFTTDTSLLEIDSFLEKGGDELVKTLSKFRGCLPGNAKISKGYNLDYKWIIHTVLSKPSKKLNNIEILLQCIQHVLEIVKIQGIKTIIFPGNIINFTNLVVIEQIFKACMECIQMQIIIYVLYNTQNDADINKLEFTNMYSSVYAK